MSEENPVIDSDDDPDPLVGTVLLDRYKIDRRLGEGGMGAVYAARHTVLDKICAIKVLHDEYTRKDDLVERFLHEARAASKIRHEHVIDVFDFGQTKKKNVFFAMEYLEGRDLADEIRASGPLSWPRTKSIMLQICAALQAAHEANIIHRDLKPENVFLIARRGNPDFVKLLDFGIAKMTEIPEGQRRLTRTGMVFGTPEYMSPEQARGDRPDPRVDVYACGCILFEMLTGEVPFMGDNFMGTLTRQIFDPVPRLAARTSREDLPPGLQAVIDHALAKDRDLRIADMNELAVAIDTLDDVPGVQYRAAATPVPVVGTPPKVATPPAAIIKPAKVATPQPTDVLLAEATEGDSIDSSAVARAASAAARAAGEAAKVANEAARVARIASGRQGSHAEHESSRSGGIGRAITIEQDGVERPLATGVEAELAAVRPRRVGLWIGAVVVLALAVGGVIYATRGGGGGERGEKGAGTVPAPAAQPGGAMPAKPAPAEAKPEEVEAVQPEAAGATPAAPDETPDTPATKRHQPHHRSGDRNATDTKPAATDTKPATTDTKPATADTKPGQGTTNEKPGSDLKNPYPRSPK